MQAVDRGTRRWVRATGRAVRFPRDAWLDGPSGDAPGIGDAWLARETSRAGVTVTDDGGLLPSTAVLDGPGFAAHDLHPLVRGFYERTAGWRLDVWAQWSPGAWPGGWLISTVFAARLGQLNLPLRPLDVAHGMTSDVVAVRGADGSVAGTSWHRRLRATGETIYAGWYDATRLPGAERSSVRVCFPLPDGRLVVLLRPEVTDAGGLVLRSGAGRWGEDGAYLVVAPPGAPGGWARRIPLHEWFHVFVDDEGVLRTDHELRLGAWPVLRLHYRLTPP